MFDCLSNDNREVKLSAERCLKNIENYDRNEYGGDGRCASMIKERRFIIHNHAWFKYITS